MFNAGRFASLHSTVLTSASPCNNKADCVSVAYYKKTDWGTHCLVNLYFNWLTLKYVWYINKKYLWLNKVTVLYICIKHIILISTWPAGYRLSSAAVGHLLTHDIFGLVQLTGTGYLKWKTLYRSVKKRHEKGERFWCFCLLVLSMFYTLRGNGSGALCISQRENLQSLR